MPTDKLPASLPQDRHFAAIALILLAFGIYTLQDTGIKFCGGHYPLAETIGFLSLGALLAVFLCSKEFRGLANARATLGQVIDRQSARLIVLYGLFATTGSLACFYAYTQMPLANAYAIAFARPLTVALLAHFMLGERLDRGIAFAIIIGFLGVILMLPLTSGGTLSGALAALFSMVCSSFSLIILRRAKGQSPTVLALCLYIVLLSSNGLLALGDFQMPTLHDLCLNIAAGIAGGIATIMTIRALHMAKAAIVAPFHYSQLFWGILSGWLVFGTTPDAKLFLGAPLVILSGLYIGFSRQLRAYRLRREASAVTA